MPYLRVSIGTSESKELATKTADLLTELTTSVLGKSQEVIAIDIQFTKPDYWFIGNQSLDSRKERSFYIEIKITGATNTRDEKSEFVKQAFKGMKEILGTVNDASYIVLHDVSSDSWGFTGKTQEFRYIEEKIKSNEKNL